MLNLTSEWIVVLLQELTVLLPVENGRHCIGLADTNPHNSPLAVYINCGDAGFETCYLMTEDFHKPAPELAAEIFALCQKMRP